MQLGFPLYFPRRMVLRSGTLLRLSGAGSSRGAAYVSPKSESAMRQNASNQSKPRIRQVSLPVKRGPELRGTNARAAARLCPALSGSFCSTSVTLGPPGASALLRSTAEEPPARLLLNAAAIEAPPH